MSELLENMDSKTRKTYPVARGLLDYFPDACAAVANVSYVGNQQHNPGEEMHWAREKSKDHADCIVRHLLARGTADDDGLLHSAKVAWRAMALLQLEIEQKMEQEKRNAAVNDPIRTTLESLPPLPPFEIVWPGYTPLIEGGHDEHINENYLTGSSVVGIDFAKGKDSNIVSFIEVQNPEQYDLSHGQDVGVGLITDMVVTDDDTLVITGEDGVTTVSHEDIKEEMIPHFYVAGPMRGLPFYNFPAFDGARDLGRSLGYTVTSPADIDREIGIDPINDYAAAAQIVENWTQDDLRAVIARDIHAILVLKRDRGDGLAVLPGWEKSTGARAEVALGRWMGLRIVSALDFETEIEVTNG